MEESPVTIASGSEIPSISDENHTVFESLDPEEGWMFPADADVKLAVQITLAIVIVLVVKVLYDYWKRLRNVHRRRIRNGEEDEQYRANTQRRMDEALRQGSHQCPICLGEASFAVLTDCGHIFCCQCIILYWQQSKAIVSPCDCAMCRSTFFLLLPVRWPSPGESDELDDQIHENNMRLDDYNRRFSIERPIYDFIRDIPILIPYLVRNFFNNDIFTVMHQVRFIFVITCAIIYFFVPFDIFPETVFGMIGFIDDCIIAFILIGGTFRWLRIYMARRGRAHQD
uniref:E3 ubiquitin-protein ligase RNF170 n=1 Tax=Caenorhabditis tropicalis TaxID=1561998 RepID=A0A1I7UC93_9PELO